MSSWKRRLRRKQETDRRGPAGSKPQRPGWPFWDTSQGEPSLMIPPALAFVKALSYGGRLLLAVLAANGGQEWTPVDLDALGRQLGSSRCAMQRELQQLEKLQAVELRPADGADEYRITAHGEALILGTAGPTGA